MFEDMANRNDYKLLQSVRQASMFFRLDKLNKCKNECWTLGLLFFYITNTLGSRTPFIKGIVTCF
jgi:hypothetical protein